MMVQLEISKDNGKTWEVVGPYNDGKELMPTASILTYPNGKMQCYAEQDKCKFSQECPRIRQDLE